MGDFGRVLCGMPEATKPLPLTANIQHRVGSLLLEVSFQIPSWPAVLFGPSGAGKSTLLRIVAGLDDADAADIRFGDRRLGRKRSGAASLQLVTQRPSLFPHLNVARNVAFGLVDMTRSLREARVKEMLALVGAEKLYSRTPQQLSGGERQRVAIARALAPNPRLLLLDEAFAGLDSSAKEDILSRLMPHFHQHSIASLHVTHEVSDAFALDAHVVVLNSGKVVAQGPAESALADQRNRLMTLLDPLCGNAGSRATHSRDL